MTRLLGLLALCSSLLPAIAAADVIGPLPTTCEEGSEPVPCHGPATCRADSCTTDADCDPGEVCQSRNYCVREHCCLGGWGGGCGPSDYVIHVDGPCTGGGGCAGLGTACRGVQVCVPGDRDGGAPVDAGSDGGAPDAGGDADPDAGSGDADAGGATDAGGEDLDAGGADEDAGTAVMDAGGGSEPDAAATAMDAGGGATVDAGTGGPTEGGCCSVTGPRESLAGELFGLALGLVVIRRLRRRR